MRSASEGIGRQSQDIAGLRMPSSGVAMHRSAPEGVAELWEGVGGLRWLRKGVAKHRMVSESSRVSGKDPEGYPEHRRATPKLHDFLAGCLEVTRYVATARGGLSKRSRLRTA